LNTSIPGLQELNFFTTVFMLENLDPSASFAKDAEGFSFGNLYSLERGVLDGPRMEDNSKSQSREWVIHA
jgi:hypothetical protein